MSDDREEALIRFRLRREAYRTVFGPPEERTPHGAVILKDLEAFARYYHRAISRDKLGRFDDSATAYNLGLQDIVRRIHQMIEWREDHDNRD